MKVVNKWIRKFFWRSILLVLGVFLMVQVGSTHLLANSSFQMTTLLSDPFLQLPTKDSVNVVWFTEFLGDKHYILYGEQFKDQAPATTTKLSRVREDSDSQTTELYTKLTHRDIWRHEATVTGLTPGKKLPYQVVSVNASQKIKSETFSLGSKPQPNSKLKILLTSDHQLMPMVTANLQQVKNTIGELDGVFLAGDLVNFPDRASEWFDDARGGAFFPALQGRGNYQLTKNGVTTTYQGAAILQNTPMYTALGNHEVMGRYAQDKSIRRQFYDAVPRTDSTQAVTKEIKNNSFNTDTYEEIFSLPKSESGGQQYYAVTFGDIRLIVLYATCIWRFPEPNGDLPTRYNEHPDDFDQPEKWGHGQHIFEPITKGSTQYQWLEKELQSPKYQEAKYKIVMFHHPPHTLGGNIVPPYTNPQQIIQRDSKRQITAISYEYAIADDYIIRDLIPLLEKAQVQLVYYGHSHLWNRFQSPSGMHFLESSNVGNSYGAHTSDNPRLVPDNPNYVAVGDPNGLEPIVPNLKPLTDNEGKSSPYVASNNITVFSILDTAKGTVSSYRFDTREPNSEAIKFDEFQLGE